MWARYFRILEADRLHIALARMAVAPEGRAIVRGTTATTTIDGLSIQIESGKNQDRDALLAAVQALEPIGSA